MIVWVITLSPAVAFLIWAVWGEYVAYKRSHAGTVSDRVADDADLDESTDPQSPVTEPYRTAAAAPPESTAPAALQRRYCINCKHLQFQYPNIQENPVCLRLGSEDDPVRGPACVPRYTTCHSNDNYDCASYVAKKGK